MQIFATNPNPQKCAEVLDDKRVIKMILESAQLLSNAYYFHNWKNPPLKKAFYNHPCSIFTRTDEGFLWLLNHFERLSAEYHLRFGKFHSYDRLFQIYFHEANKIKVRPFWENNVKFVNCTLHKDIKDTFLAYKITLCEKWANNKRKPKWTNSQEPQWRKEICDGYGIPYV